MSLSHWNTTTKTLTWHASNYGVLKLHQNYILLLLLLLFSIWYRLISQTRGSTIPPCPSQVAKNSDGQELILRKCVMFVYVLLYISVCVVDFTGVRVYTIMSRVSKCVFTCDKTSSSRGDPVRLKRCKNPVTDLHIFACFFLARLEANQNLSGKKMLYSPCVVDVDAYILIWFSYLNYSQI